MKRILMVVALIAVAAPVNAQERLADQLRKGIAEEETGKSLDKAIQAYQAIVARYDEDRKVAGTALLRLAEYLDRSRTQVIHHLTCRVQPRAVELICHTRGDASTEVWSTQSHTDLFKQAFKRDVIIQTRPIKSARVTARSIETVATPEADPLWTRVREIMHLLNSTERRSGR